MTYKEYMNLEIGDTVSSELDSKLVVTSIDKKEGTVTTGNFRETEFTNLNLVDDNFESVWECNDACCSSPYENYMMEKEEEDLNEDILNMVEKLDGSELISPIEQQVIELIKRRIALYK